MQTIPNRASDAGPEDHSADMTARDYIDLAIEALQMSKRFMIDPKNALDDLAQAEGYIQSAQQKLKEGK